MVNMYVASCSHLGCVSETQHERSTDAADHNTEDFAAMPDYQPGELTRTGDLYEGNFEHRRERMLAVLK